MQSVAAHDAHPLMQQVEYDKSITDILLPGCDNGKAGVFTLQYGHVLNYLHCFLGPVQSWAQQDVDITCSALGQD
jgi:hypothetical protein